MSPIIPPYVPPYSPLPNLTPFTQRDALTYNEVLEGLRRYINEVIVPFVNENVTELGNEFTEEVNKLITDVNTALAEQTEDVDAKILALETYVNEQVALIIEDSVDVQDPVVAALVANVASATRIAMNAVFAPISTISATNATVATYISDAGATQTAADARYAPVSNISATNATVAGYVSGAGATQTAGDARWAPVSTVSGTNATVAGYVSGAGATQTALDARFAPFSQVAHNDGIVIGTTGKRYRHVGGVIRPNASGVWDLITDVGHQSTGVQAITQDTDNIFIAHAVSALKVVDFVCQPDETLAGLFDTGVSVGLASTALYLSQRHISDSISFNGTEWTALNNNFTMSFSAGILTLTHQSRMNLSTLSRLDTAVVGRDGASTPYLYQIASAGLGNTTTAISIRDYAGALVTTPNTNMRFIIRIGDMQKRLDPSYINSVAYPNGNIWFSGTFEIA